MKLPSLLVLAFALAVCAAPPARADFKVLPAPSIAKPLAAVEPRPGYVPLDGLKAPDDASATKPSSKGFGLVAVSYVGTPSADIEIRQGMGRDVRIADALKQIAPPGWRGFGRADIAESFDPNAIVSWKGGRPWTDVLDILANEQDLAIEVDWQRKHLYVGKRGSKAPSTQIAVAAVPARPIEPPQMWAANAGATVRSTFEQWAKRAGWTVVWPMDDLDYQIVAPLSFDGSIVDAASKLTRLFESAERPIAVSIHTNQKVLVFSEKGGAQ